MFHYEKMPINFSNEEQIAIKLGYLKGILTLGDFHNIIPSKFKRTNAMKRLERYGIMNQRNDGKFDVNREKIAEFYEPDEVKQ